MGYTQQQKNKISKYYFRMNKACGQKNVKKVSDYFDHLKHHVMTGGATAEEVNSTIEEISRIIAQISSNPALTSIEDSKKIATGAMEKFSASQVELETANIELARLREELASVSSSGNANSAELDALRKEISSKTDEILALQSALDLTNEEMQTINYLNDQFKPDTTAELAIDILSDVQSNGHLGLAATQLRNILKQLKDQNAEKTSLYDSIVAQLNAIQAEQPVLIANARGEGIAEGKSIALDDINVAGFEEIKNGLQGLLDKLNIQA